jgi:MFS family permease
MSRTEKLNLYLLFLLFGLGIMAIAPRNPEIKHNLAISNGTFGTLISAGGIGSVLSLIFGGHIVHRLGPRPVLIASATIMYSAIAVIPHLHSALLFLLMNIIIGISMSGYHIAINGQALHRQDESGEVLIPRLHGLWSVGALGTAIFAFLITSHVSLAWHIDVMMALIWLFTLASISKLKPYFIGGVKEEEKSPIFSFNKLIAAFKYERLITFGLLCVLMIEFSTNDWATIFAKEQIGMSASLSILPYIIFVISMIFGRFTIHKLLLIKPENYWMRWGPLLGGMMFLILLIVGNQVAHLHREVGFILILLSFIFAGIGCSHLAPTFFGIASRKSDLPGSVVVAQLGLVNTILVFLLKIIISWIVQLTSVIFALLIPGFMLLGVILVADLGRKEVLLRN